MLECERSLLVCMTLQAACICACCEPRLLEFETTVRIVTVTALDQAFKHLMMKRSAELGLRLAVTTDAKLRFAASEHVGR